MLGFQEQMVKKLKLATLKSSARLNMQVVREYHYKALNGARENGITENIEELDKQHIFNEDMEKAEKYAETIQVLQKDLKRAKLARKAADNSTCLQ